MPMFVDFFGRYINTDHILTIKILESGGYEDWEEVPEGYIPPAKIVIEATNGKEFSSAFFPSIKNAEKWLNKNFFLLHHLNKRK